MNYHDALYAEVHKSHSLKEQLLRELRCANCGVLADSDQAKMQCPAVASTSNIVSMTLNPR